MKKIVTFDFDKTLSDKKEVRDYAKELISRGIDVYILTFRFDNLHYHLYNDRGEYYTPNDNTDLYEVADYVGISRDRIIFTNEKPKSEYLNSCGRVAIHLDDCQTTLKDILYNCETHGVDVMREGKWKGRMETLIRRHISG